MRYDYELGTGRRVVALSNSSHEQTQQTESAVFFYCRFSLLLGDPFFPDYLEVVADVLVLRGVGKTFPCTSI